jgi:DNA (cytosine-5)-methyltransferase 1
LRDAFINLPASDGVEYNAKKKELFPLIPEGGCWINLLEDKQREYLGNSYNSGGGKRGILRRLAMDKPSLTLLCTPTQKQTERCHPLEDRPLNLGEYARIQTFDDNHKFIGSISSRYKQIGNAVPVELARRIGIQLKKVIDNED